MDKREAKPNRYAWLPAAMPKVAALVAEKRRLLGDAHVNDCWARGMRGEPGYFFAREGAIAIGTPFTDDPVCAQFGAQHIKSGQALVLIRSPEGADGKA